MGRTRHLTDLDRLVLALSDAFDLVGVDRLGHCRRVAAMAVAVAEELCWHKATIRMLMHAALLHDCGVSTTGEHHDLMGDLSWNVANEHSVRGAECLKRIPELAHLAPIVAEHHTPWDALGDRLPEDEALIANLIHLVDRIDAKRNHCGVVGRNIVGILRRHTGFFSPELLAAADQVTRCEAFWFFQEEPVLTERLTSFIWRWKPIPLDLPAVLRVAEVVGAIIDRKSTYTERHSLGVARVAGLLARWFELAPDTCTGIEIAAYLHDIGKLRIPDQLLDKQGTLDPIERMRMARHAFDTRAILTRAFGEGGIADWAGFHHECLSGNGYPFHLGAEFLSLETRIVAVADVFQALAQHRPYRAPLTIAEITALMDGMVFAGRLDHDVVELCKAHGEECWIAATRGDK